MPDINRADEPRHTLPITLCIISLNEARHITACIESVPFVSEIIVVDSGSTDGTVEIALSHGARVEYREFKGYIPQKNYCHSLVSNEWILSLDADEQISPELQRSIVDLFRTQPACAGYSMPRRTFYIDDWIRHCGWYPDRKIRLFRKSCGKWSGNIPHEKLVLDGDCGKLKGDILHYSFDNLSAHVDTINRFSSLKAQSAVTSGKTRFTLIKMLVKPTWKFVEMFFIKRGFLDGRNGLIVASFSAFSTLIKFAKIIEWKHTDPRPGPDQNGKQGDSLRGNQPPTPRSQH